MMIKNGVPSRKPPEPHATLRFTSAEVLDYVPSFAELGSACIETWSGSELPSLQTIAANIGLTLACCSFVMHENTDARTKHYHSSSRCAKPCRLLRIDGSYRDRTSMQL